MKWRLLKWRSGWGCWQRNMEIGSDHTSRSTIRQVDWTPVQLYFPTLPCNNICATFAAQDGKSVDCDISIDDERNGEHKFWNHSVQLSVSGETSVLCLIFTLFNIWNNLPSMSCMCVFHSFNVFPCVLECCLCDDCCNSQSVAVLQDISNQGE